MECDFSLLLKQELKSPLRYEFWPALQKESSKLLIVLHGRGDTLEGFHFLPSSLGLDDLNTVFLQAPDTYGMGFSWYDLPPNQGVGILRSRKLLFDFIDEVIAKSGIQATDIFLFGFSQGSLMCVDVGLRYPFLLGGIVGVSGYIFFEDDYPAAFSSCALKQRFLITHGFEDDVLPFEKSEASVIRLKNLGVQIEWQPFHKAHTVDEVDEILVIKSFLLGS